MKNISKKEKFNIDAIAEARKDKNFQRDSEGATVKIKLAVEIFNARESMGMSQQKLAKEIGSTQREISRIENGDVNVGVELLNRIQKKLGFTSNNFAEIFDCSSLVRWDLFQQTSNDESVREIKFKTDANTINSKQTL